MAVFQMSFKLENSEKTNVGWSNASFWSPKESLVEFHRHRIQG
jgi:hypothetical protein